MDIRDWVGFKHSWYRAFEVQLRTGSPPLQREGGQRFGRGKGSLAWLAGSELIISRQEFASWSCYVAGLHPLRLPPMSKPFAVLPDTPTCQLVIGGGQRGCSLNSQSMECGLCPQSNGEPRRTLAEARHARFHVLKDHEQEHLYKPPLWHCS